MIYTKRIRRIINILYLIAAIFILLSATFKLQHYPHGNLLWNIGFGLGIIVSLTDNQFLRKELEKRTNTELNP